MKQSSMSVMTYNKESQPSSLSMQPANINKNALVQKKNNQISE
jgi:hypothetical protein